MSKIDDYLNGAKKIIDDEEYMAKMSNWLCAHVTNYMPGKDENGNFFIQTTAMATGYKRCRPTVHVTLNQTVQSHMMGNWDNAAFVILAPYNDVVKMNGNPSMVATEDTYFIPNPDTGLVLPKNTYIIKPDDKTLFSIGENVATYKTNNFTEQDIETIKKHIKFSDRSKYEELVRGEVPEWELKNIFSSDPDLKEKYDKNKDETVKEICEKLKNELLTQTLRDMVVRMTMQEMGYHYVFASENGASAAAAETAIAAGIPGNSGKAAHSVSLEKCLEANAERLNNDLYFLENETNVDTMYDHLTYEKGSFMDSSDPKKVNKFIRECILQNAHVDFYDMYTELFSEYMNEEKKIYYKTTFNTEPPKTIEEYNQSLDTVMHRNANIMNAEYKRVCEQLKKNPRYPELVTRLKDYENPKQKNFEFEIDESALTEEMRVFLGLSKQKS